MQVNEKERAREKERAILCYKLFFHLKKLTPTNVMCELVLAIREVLFMRYSTLNNFLIIIIVMCIYIGRIFYCSITQHLRFPTLQRFEDGATNISVVCEDTMYISEFSLLWIANLPLWPLCWRLSSCLATKG